MNGNTLLQAKLLLWAKQKGDAVCLIETKTGEQMTYSELVSAVTALDAYLGNEPKVIVSALSGGIVDSVVWITCLIGGHTHIPMSPHVTDYEYENIIKKHAPDIIIKEDDIEIVHPKGKILTKTECLLIISEKTKSSSHFKAKDGNVLLFTSGSTSEPKGVLLTATQMIVTAENIVKAHQLTENDRALTPLPFYHVNAPVVSLLTTLLSGSCLIIAPKYSTTNFWKWVETYDPTWISLVPTMIVMLLHTEKPDFLQTSSLRFIRTASASLPRVVLERFEEKFSIPLIETYGISEAASTIASNPLPPHMHKPGSVGFPIGVKLRIIAPSPQPSPLRERELAQGETGEVWIQGENVITSYENNAGSDAFQDGWFCTGDLGYFDADDYLFLVGREKEVIIRGGENIAPREIEEVLLTHRGIQEVAVVGQSDEVYGEKVVAFIVLQADDTSIATDEIKVYIGHKLSAQKIPTDIHILEALPRGRTGKIDKKELRNREV